MSDPPWKPLAPARFRRRGGYALVILALLGVAALGFFQRYRALALPEHAIHFEVQRDDAHGIATTFLRHRTGADLSGYSSSTLFDLDSPAKLFLEKEFGIQRATEFAGDAGLWWFETRYFRPLQKEEFKVRVDPAGKVVGYSHVIDEGAAGGHLPREQALAVAEATRAEVAPGSGHWRLVEGTSTQRPARLDWRFTWERSDVEIRPSKSAVSEAGQLRLEIQIHGDQLGGIRRFLKVPEAWERDYQRIRAANSLALMLDVALTLVPLVIFALAFVVRGHARRGVHWRTPLSLGAVGGLLILLESVNQLPQAVATYDTLTAWEGFIALVVVNGVMMGLGYGIAITILAAAGELVYRQVFPQHLQLGACFSWRGVMTRQGAVALGVGGLCGLVGLAYMVCFYIIGNAVGIWSPAAIDYSKALSAPVPWFMGPVMGYIAATSEEFAYRLFGMPLLILALTPLLRRAGVALCVAIVATAASWAFLHVTHPQDPFFARPLELTIAGTVLALLCVRFGILAPLSAHYSYNALLGAAAVDRIGPATAILAYGVALFPLFVAGAALVGARLRGDSYSEAGLLNRDLPSRLQELATSRETRAPVPYHPLSARIRRISVLLTVAGIVAICGLCIAVPPLRALRVSRDEAIARTDLALAGVGIETTGMIRVAYLESRPGAGRATERQSSAGSAPENDTLVQAYLRETAGPQTGGQVFGNLIPTNVWVVRYSRPLQRDEYRVELLGDSDDTAPALAIWADLADDTAGARLSRVEAQVLAQYALREIPGWHGESFVLAGERTIDRPNRTDHHFTFEHPDLRWGHATYRAEVSVIGAQVSGFRPFIKLPEEWEREHSQMSVRRTTSTIVLALGVMSVVLLNGFMFLRLAQGGGLVLRTGVATGLGFGLLGLLELLNSFPLLYRAYQTAMPAETHVIGALTANLMGIGLMSVLAGVIGSGLVGLWSEDLGVDAVPTSGRRAWAIDAALVALACSALAIAAEQCLAVFIRGHSASLVPSSATLVPAAAVLAESRVALLIAAGAALCYLQIKRLVKRNRWLLSGAFAFALFLPLSAPTISQAQEALVALVSLLALGAVAARWLCQTNLASYLLGLGCVALLTPGVALIRTADSWLIANGIAILIAVVLGLIGFIIWAGKQEQRKY